MRSYWSSLLLFAANVAYVIHIILHMSRMPVLSLEMGCVKWRYGPLNYVSFKLTSSMLKKEYSY